MVNASLYFQSGSGKDAGKLLAEVTIGEKDRIHAARS